MVQTGRSAVKTELFAPWQERLARFLLLALVVIVPWPWGSVGVIAQSFETLMVGIALGLALLSPGSAGWPRSRCFRLGVWLWLIWLLWLALGLLPLPVNVLGALSPAAERLHAQALWPGETLSAGTITLAWAASAGELLNSLALFGLYLLAARVLRGQGHRQRLLLVMAIVGAAQALYGVGMTLTGAEMGFFARKWSGLGWATGTFVNRNHFAHLLALAGAVALALLLARPAKSVSQGGWRGSAIRIINWLMSPALVWRSLVLILLVGVVVSQSRMGNVAFVLALAVGLLLWVLLHGRRHAVTALLLIASFVVADLWIVDRYYGLDRVVQRLDQTDLRQEQRAVALRDLLPLVETYALTGSGGGSFQSVFMATQSSELTGFYDHAHNEYAEFAIEHGIPGLVWMLLIGLLHAAHALRLLYYRHGVGARALGLATLMALTAAAIHASAEFVLHIQALRFWLVVLLGAVAGATANPYSSGKGLARGSRSPDQPILASGLSA